MTLSSSLLRGQRGSQQLHRHVGDRCPQLRATNGSGLLRATNGSGLLREGDERQRKKIRKTNKAEQLKRASEDPPSIVIGAAATMTTVTRALTQ